ncbi:MAG: flagellar biosynthetic protein FliR [Deltaproteobacteria bacterium]|nr:flagellar biosynthetic protein FliR [Deltaproteobacteria bacterium]
MNVFQWDEAQILTFFHVLVRVTSVTAFVPIFGDKVVPAIVKILFGLALACVVHPVAWAGGMRIDPAVAESAGRLAMSVGGEALFGVALGFVSRWIFDAIQFSGHFAGIAIGFSMASVLDPHSETQTVSFAEMQYMLAALLFLAMDGHHLYLSALVDSFRIVPVTGVKILAMSQGLAQYFINMTAEVFLLGLKLSAPVVTVVLLVNLTFGMLARAVPQLNALILSFAANIVIGLFVMVLSLPAFVSMVNGAFDSYMPEIERFLHLLGSS